MSSASAVDGAIQIKINARGVVRAWKGMTWVLLNEDMNYFISIKSLENSGVLIGELIKTVKYEIKRQEGGFLGMLLEH